MIQFAVYVFVRGIAIRDGSARTRYPARSKRPTRIYFVNVAAATMDGEPDAYEDARSVIENAEFVIDDGQYMAFDRRTDEEDSDDDDDQEKVHDPGYCCSRRCESMFDDEFKSLLKSSMSKLSLSEKRIHLFTMITVDHRNPIRKKKCAKPRPCFEYVVKEYGVSRSVCKTAFIRLHGASLSMVRRTCDQALEILPLDRRSKNGKKTTVPKETQKLIKSHLFSVLESPTVSFYSNL